MSDATPPDAPFPLSEVLEGKKILLTGSTGFLGKVYLCSLLTHFPQIGQVVALVRAKDDQAAADRFVRDVVTSPAFAGSTAVICVNCTTPVAPMIAP